MATIYEKMTAIGDAIRGKTGGTELLTLDEMASEISGISTGVELNFEVVGSTSQPSTTNENTIWINTSTAIISYTFSAEEPENTSEGMVWITVGASSGVAFSATKENPIMIYPISAKQYVNGAWVDKTAKIYQNGAWVDWWNGELYEAGNEFEGTTGGWIAEAVPITSGSDGEAPIIQRNLANMVISGSPDCSGIVRTKNKVSIDSAATLYLDATIESDLSAEHDSWLDLYVWSEIGAEYTENIVAYICLEGKNESNIFIVSIPAGKYYVGFGMYQDYSTITMRKLYIG